MDSLIYFIIIYFLFGLYPLSVYSYDSVLYTETELGLKVNQLINFKDKMILHMVKPINESCIEPRIDFRVLYSNGTIEEAKVDYPIPEFNFCAGPTGFLGFQFRRFLSGFLSVTYINSTDLASTSYYALIVTQTGKVISNQYLSPAPIINGSIYADSFIRLDNLDQIEEEGFIFTNFINETTIMWKYFIKLDDKGNFTEVNNGTLNQLQNPSSLFDVFPGIEGKFFFVTKEIIDTETTKCDEPNNPTEITVKVAVSFIKPKMNNAINGPFIIYQSTIPRLDVDHTYCVSSTGIFCILAMKADKESQKNFLLRVSLQDSGSVVSIERFADVEFGDGNIAIASLRSGGFLLTIKKDTGDDNRVSIQGMILNNDGKYYRNWDFPPDLTVSDEYNTMGGYQGIIMLIKQENEFTWSVSYSKSPELKLIPNGYNSPDINSSYPSINSIIPISTTQINITYNLPVEISNNNISIYQNNGDGLPILRQSIPGNYPSKIFSHSSDNKTIFINILESTFNQPNASYYISIADNAVKDWKSSQALLGVRKNLWKFDTTGTGNHDIFADDAEGLFSLTPEGTKYFESLSQIGQSKFLSQLRIDLSETIPIDLNRLDDIECCKHDKGQILLTLSIKSTLNANERNVVNVIKDLDLLIREKDMTRISWVNTTNLIDANYGFQQNRYSLHSFKFHFIGFTIGVIILGLFYLYAKKKYPMGKNIVIFKFSLIILDFTMDFLFIINNGRRVQVLFIPSIIFCVIPIAINSIMSMIIILKEVTRNKFFYEWFKNNTNIAALFTILAGADIEILCILFSKVAGIKSFDAPISEKAQSYIFWGSLLGFFIEDIPQFVIQVLYRHYTVEDTISRLSLLSSSIILANNIVSKIYHSIVQLNKKRRMSRISNMV